MEVTKINLSASAATAIEAAIAALHTNLRRHVAIKYINSDLFPVWDGVNASHEEVCEVLDTGITAEKIARGAAGRRLIHISLLGMIGWQEADITAEIDILLILNQDKVWVPLEAQGHITILSTTNPKEFPIESERTIYEGFVHWGGDTYQLAKYGPHRPDGECSGCAEKHKVGA